MRTKKYFFIIVLVLFILVIPGCLNSTNDLNAEVKYKDKSPVDTDQDNIGKDDENNPRSTDPELIGYFLETALGSEFGSTQQVVHKWRGDIDIRVNGSPTGQDKKTLSEVISELNYLIDEASLNIVNIDPDIEMYFTTAEEFASIEPNYIPPNRGFFWMYMDREGYIYKGRIFISTQGVTQKERSHLIREELTQSLGIMNDSYLYKDSIFYQEWTDTTQYALIDKAVIGLLYDPRLKVGMTAEDVLDAIEKY